ncbi:hypothetical protein BGZ95_010581 [Linnemannia exigua]|uniref:Uncharacterized protein n=1 Tax=Linnemannia exigua TaxID=604196 RepID=A0AAD4H719_9FUNG|nr:hypothetical protein BGZ95_010581 [Linnemannia exigua]
MSNFSLDARLDTPNPFLIEFLGPPSAVVHKIAGKLIMTVTKPIQLKQLSVAFVGQATTDPTTLTLTSISWEHLLVSSAIPVGLMSRRKEFRKKIELKRVQVEPSSNALSQFGSSRTDQIDCSIHTYKFVGLEQDRLKVKLYMHAYSSQYRVKEVLIGAVQTEWVEIDMSSHDLHNRGKRFVVPNKEIYQTMSRLQHTHGSIAKHYHTSPISNVISLQNPDQEIFSTSWGREDAIECELDLFNKVMVPSEFTTWMKVGHTLQLTIVFADPEIRSMVVKPPFTVVRILQDPWTHHTLRNLHQDYDHHDNHDIHDSHRNVLHSDHSDRHRGPDNSALPGYGEGIEDTTLLDSNTHRIDHSVLYHELYPERSELVVPDIADDLPPTYESEVERPTVSLKG